MSRETRWGKLQDLRGRTLRRYHHFDHDVSFFSFGDSGNVSLILGRKTSLGRKKPEKDSVWGIRLGFQNIEKKTQYTRRISTGSVRSSSGVGGRWTFPFEHWVSNPFSMTVVSRLDSIEGNKF
jgi:hypothetical protein